MGPAERSRIDGPTVPLRTGDALPFERHDHQLIDGLTGSGIVQSAPLEFHADGTQDARNLRMHLFDQRKCRLLLEVGVQGNRGTKIARWRLS
jgi:hypothetical protein